MGADVDGDDVGMHAISGEEREAGMDVMWDEETNGMRGTDDGLVKVRHPRTHSQQRRQRAARGQVAAL